MRALPSLSPLALASSVALVAPVALVALASPGCSDDGGGSSSGCTDYSPPAGFDATKPAVKFSTDVMGVFQRSCAFSTCHGSNVGPANGVFLGAAPARVHTALVGVKSGELPAMPLVTAGDPRQSYLMRKMDGSQCALDAQCTGGSCSGSMPKGSEVLPVETRDIVRRWIAQGAKND